MLSSAPQVTGHKSLPGADVFSVLQSQTIRLITELCGYGGVLLAVSPIAFMAITKTSTVARKFGISWIAPSSPYLRECHAMY
jgi:hypothetical protein